MRRSTIGLVALLSLLSCPAARAADIPYLTGRVVDHAAGEIGDVGGVGANGDQAEDESSGRKHESRHAPRSSMGGSDRVFAVPLRR